MKNEQGSILVSISKEVKMQKRGRLPLFQSFCLICNPIHSI